MGSGLPRLEAWCPRGCDRHLRRRLLDRSLLELAFSGLRAAAATSGFVEGTGRSARVSAKLGYREIGISEISPRGIPVPHHDLRLERKDWVPPFPVEISGLEPALPLFGVA